MTEHVHHWPLRYGPKSLSEGQFRREKTHAALQIFWNLFLLTVGSVICAIAVNGILIPQKFFATGFTGVALLIHYVVPTVSVGWVYLLLNIPGYIIGWVYVGRRFFLYSVAGLLIFSTAIEVIQVTIAIEDKILSALLAGILVGAGGGAILRSLGSAGGLDIISVIFMKRYSIRIGSSVLAFNVLLLFFIAIRFSVESALYALIFTFVSSRVVNLVVTGLSQRKAAMIISAKWREISREVLDQMHRGVTALEGEGMYTGEKSKILYIVVTFQEISRLKRKIRQIDPDAFVVFTDTMEVMAKGIGNQPHW